MERSIIYICTLLRKDWALRGHSSESYRFCSWVVFEFGFWSGSGFWSRFWSGFGFWLIGKGEQLGYRDWKRVMRIQDEDDIFSHTITSCIICLDLWTVHFVFLFFLLLSLRSPSLSLSLCFCLCLCVCSLLRLHLLRSSFPFRLFAMRKLHRTKWNELLL
jgi:hypothetical protein